VSAVANRAKGDMPPWATWSGRIMSGIVVAFLLPEAKYDYDLGLPREIVGALVSLRAVLGYLRLRPLQVTPACTRLACGFQFRRGPYRARDAARG
jgi:hypothetical protein